ncbi:MAG TPA: protein kinase [Chlamydiales bacterium]
MYTLPTMTDDDFSKQRTLPGLTSSDARSSVLPQKIGPYRIESLLSKGGMSYVYLGIHPGTTQPVVIKVLSPKFQTHREMIKRFLKEAEVIGMTDHPNIVKLYGQGMWEKGFYIVIEFIQGVSLRQFIQQKSLSEKKALEIILQVAYALCHLHTHGVIHRDIKPENILITESGEVKVIDFGISQLQSEESIPRPSKGHRVMGTPSYMSPEQKENPLNVSYSSDIYSLGIIAYELLLGRLSYGVIHLPLLPKELRALIEKALQPDPKERYQDIVDFITDISQYLKHSQESVQQKTEEIPEEMLNMIQHTKELLIPLKPPSWPPVEIGIALHEGSLLTGLCIDFFRLPSNCFCLMIGEPEATGVAALIHSSIVRGMIRMAMEYGFRSGKKEPTLAKFLSGLNKTLCEDSARSSFGLSLLLLNPEKEKLTFASCGHSSLWHIPDGSTSLREITTPNVPLGTHINASILEGTDNWGSGDTLIVNSFSKQTQPKERWIKESLLLPPKQMAEKTLEHLLLENPKQRQRSSAALSIQRIF